MLQSDAVRQKAIDSIGLPQGRRSHTWRILRTEWMPDVLLASLLALLLGIASFQASRLLDPRLVQGSGVWFSADIGRVYNNMTDRGSDHYRTKVHPLFSILVHPPVYAVRRALGLERPAAVRLAVAGIAGAWLALFFILLRSIGCRRLDAVVFTLLAGCSAASMFWTIEPESYALGSITLLAALLVVAATERRAPSELSFMLVSALTLSITITNWMGGLLATAVAFPWRRAVQITTNAFCLVVVLWGAQKFLYPSAQFFLGDKEEANYMFRAEAGGPLTILRAFTVHSVVMPAVQVVDAYDIDNGPIYAGRRLGVQSSPVGSGGRWGPAAASLWIGLLGLGCWALFAAPGQRRFRLALGLTLVGQLGLHLLYGEETFLYSMHFMPLLVALPALSTLTRVRRLALALASFTVAFTALNNAAQFERSPALLRECESGRKAVLDEMGRRPSDPWPRGTGHVILALPGSEQRDKAYHEPGASFSPAPGSFGVSIWLVDRDGRVVLTSDTVPLTDIHQHFILRSDRLIPDLLTETPYYRATWSLQAPGRWQLYLEQTGALRPVAVVRSVGPAGGRIEYIGWKDDRVHVNERWQVEMRPAPATVHVGDEETPRWMTEQRAVAEWHTETGWGYARLEPSAKEWTLTITDVMAGATSDRPQLFAAARPALDLPDARFAESVDAQVAHLLMGLVNNETRPGDPLSYPLPWLRDGSYAIVGLARAGQLQTAKTLVEYMAEHDFYGGFGSEADAPGLALWSIEEVAARMRDERFDAWLWPHVRRKVAWIERMLAARAPLDQPVAGLIAPTVAGRRDLGRVADAARNGLIVGRMDFERPLLFVNAVSYRGLLDAASLAERSGHQEDAAAWRRIASQLQGAWETAFSPPESENDRTFIASLWPTGIGYGIRSKVQAGLENRWMTRRTVDGDFRDLPSWTYFEVAEAHQWLFVGDTNRVWTTLGWFWNHQASPGLYTWWEPGQNAFYDWLPIRGWVRPPHITPHYWTAAEMLLLQLDMLAYEQPTSGAPLVIGAGVPESWLKKPLQVERLSLLDGRLDWSWDGSEVRVRASWPINASRVRLGAAFPATTPIKVDRF